MNLENAIRNQVGANTPPQTVEELCLDTVCATKVSGLDPFINLRVLTLNGCGITTLEDFPTLPKLKVLELSNNVLSGTLEELQECGLFMLEQITLAGNNFATLESLQPLDSLPALRDIDLYGCPVTELDNYREGVFNSLPNLQYLDGCDEYGNEKAEDEEQPPMNVRSAAETCADKARACALAMALHPRLGAASPAAWLHSDLLRRIATFLRVSSSRRLVAVHVRSGTLIDRIELRYTDGSARTCGGGGGEWREPFLLAPGESIVRLKLWAGDALDSIKFVTNRGRSSPRYGGRGGVACEDLVAPSGHEILSLRMRRTDDDWLAPPYNQHADVPNIEMDLAQVPSASDIAEMDAYFAGFRALHAQPPNFPLTLSGPLEELPNDDDDGEGSYYDTDFLSDGEYDDFFDGEEESEEYDDDDGLDFAF